jgi:hypothetical protein
MIGVSSACVVGSVAPTEVGVWAGRLHAEVNNKTATMLFKNMREIIFIPRTPKTISKPSVSLSQHL